MIMHAFRHKNFISGFVAATAMRAVVALDFMNPLGVLLHRHVAQMRVVVRVGHTGGSLRQRAAV
jgi:hypothetical protein